MELAIIKKELGSEEIVKVEQASEHAVILPGFNDNSQEVVSSENIPQIIQTYQDTENERNVQVVQLEDGQYAYIIENPDVLEEGSQYEFADGEHYVIEEYASEYDETSDQSQFETIYVQSVDSPQAEDVPTTEVYTISEETDEVEGDNYYDDEQMAIVEEVECVLEEKQHVRKKQVHVKKSSSPPPLVQIERTKQVQREGKREIRKSARKPRYPVTEGEEIIYLKTEPSPENEHQETQDNTTTTNIILEEQGEQVITEVTKLDNADQELLYECSICSKTFRTSTGVKRHLTLAHMTPTTTESQDVLSFSLCPCCGEPSDSAHTTGDFKCETCEKLFILQTSLDRHKSIEHPPEGKYECYDCKKQFETQLQLIEHTKIHSLKSVKCTDCGKEFSRKYHLDRHIGQTGCTGVPKQVYECRVCNKSFTRKDNLAEHLKGHAGIMNKKKKHFTCEFCMKEFSGLALLQIHVRTHTGERPYGCDICEKRFPSGGAMKKHRRKHTGEKPYSCPQCNAKFAAKETLNRHWRTHTGEKPHVCKFCGKAFIQPSQLRAHIFHHTGENAFTCPHCNRAFNRKLRLTTHIKYMHEGAQPLNCLQEGCTKTFFRKEDLTRHMLTHSNTKPFSCDVCGKSFSVKSSLKMHKNTHIKEPPVSCEVCNRAFIRKDCLMRHMRAKHRDVVEEIVTNAEKKRLQNQLLRAVSTSANKKALKNTPVWNELTLTESIKELLSLLVDEECLSEFGHPNAPVDKVLESVIKRCGHSPASETDFDYIGKMRENAKLLFTVVIDDQAVKELLNNQTVDEVIIHVLKLARKQAGNLIDDESEEIDIKPTVVSEDVLEGETEEIILETENDGDEMDNSEEVDDPDQDDTLVAGESAIEFIVDDNSVTNEEQTLNDLEDEEEQMEIVEN